MDLPQQGKVSLMERATAAPGAQGAWSGGVATGQGTAYLPGPTGVVAQQ